MAGDGAKDIAILKTKHDTLSDANTMQGMPILLSGNNQDPAFKPLSRVGMQDNGTANYHECLLQELIDEQPSVLPICDFLPGVGNLFSLGREIPADVGGSECSIDNLLVTDDGRLVLVETKLWRNPEALREVIAQTLQYGMAVSEFSPIDFEDRLRRGGGKRLGQDDTVTQYVRKIVGSDSRLDLDDDFEDRLDQFRCSGEILLLVVGDGIRPSVERLIRWIDGAFGYKPYKFGLVELRLYDVPDGGRIVVPKTLLRTREVSRHVVSIDVKSAVRDQVTVSVRGSDGSNETKPNHTERPPVTEEALTGLIQANNPPEIAAVAEQLRTRLRSSGLTTKYCPTEILYGVDVEGDFISLVHLGYRALWFLIPMRAIRALGEERSVECKRRINRVAVLYQPSTVDDPNRNGNVLSARYSLLKDKVDDFVKAVTEIAQEIRSAMAEPA